MLCTWSVYILRCADGSLYTGVTTDTARRVEEHNSARKSARYTRARRPVTLVYSEPAADRSAACKREAEIKRLSRKQKLLLINSEKNTMVESNDTGEETSGSIFCQCN